MAMSLNKIQQSFMNYLQNGELDYDLIHGRNMAHKQALADVYHYAYRARFIEVLTEQYPKLSKILGDEAFAVLVDSYAKAHPSRFCNVRDFGAALPGFIADTFSGEKAVLLAELAQFEWMLLDVFDAADSPYLSIEQLQAIDPASWPSRKLIFQKAMQWKSFNCDVLSLWHNGETPASPASCAKPPTSCAESAGPTHILVWRCNREVFFAPLTPSETLFLESAARGDNLESICEHLLKLHTTDNIPKVLSSSLQRFTKRRCIADFIC